MGRETMNPMYDVDFIGTTIRDVLTTPQMTDVHIEFDASLDEAPILRYSVERHVVRSTTSDEKAP